MSNKTLAGRVASERTLQEIVNDSYSYMKPIGGHWEGAERLVHEAYAASQSRIAALERERDEARTLFHALVDVEAKKHKKLSEAVAALREIATGGDDDRHDFDVDDAKRVARAVLDKLGVRDE